eukprot:3444871-Ditylum_brightwellii.AAC.1
MMENPEVYFSLETVPAIKDTFKEYNLAGLQPSIFFGDENLEDPEATNAFMDIYDEAEDKVDSDNLPTDHFWMPPAVNKHDNPEEGQWPISLAEDIALEHLQQALPSLLYAK